MLIYRSILHACLKAKKSLPDVGRCLCISCIAAEVAVKVMLAVAYFVEFPLIKVGLVQAHLLLLVELGCSKPVFATCLPP